MEVKLLASLTNVPDDQLHAPVILFPAFLGQEAGWAPESVWKLQQKL
jgi:hypothetical protein